MPIDPSVLAQVPSLEECQAILRHRARNKIAKFYPDTGPLRRELYPKHLAFFAAGSEFRERAAICANRVGKTEGIGAYETALHLTGQYPKWWPGLRFKKPISAWACGKTNLTTRDILQAKLLGKIARDKGDDASDPIGLGTGMVPGDAIRTVRPKAGIPNAIETAFIRHVTGGTSVLTFKSYEQGRGAFEGTEQDVVWYDEEPSEDVYNEGLVRTMKTGAFEGGICLLTFTPLDGWSNVVEMFLNEHDRTASKRFVIQAGWDDAPHLSEDEKTEMLAKLPPHQRDARSKGIPQLGSGAIYPVPESDIVVPDRIIPENWPRAFGLDVGFNRTAAVWAARDPESKVIYLYSEHYMGKAEPSIHAAAIRARGDWIPGVIDPASRGRSQADGRQLIQDYRDLGLNLEPADNAVESGLFEVWQLLSGGMLKVFASLNNWLAEFRLYRRDDKGHIVKKADHCFHPDTLVITDRGSVPIRDLVGKTGKVLSRSGAWVGFYGARRTASDVPVVRLRFEDGSEIVCTHDHRFLTPSGWCYASVARNVTCYNGVAQCIQLSHWKSRLFRQPFRNFRDFVTTCAEGISSAMEFGSTGLSGAPQTVVPFLMGSTSTTRTRTEPTTNTPTLNFAKSMSTPLTTSREEITRLPGLPSKKPLSGTVPQRELSGTASTLRTSSISSTREQSSLASSAENSSPRRSPGRTDSAPTTASPHFVGRLTLTTRNAFAWFAAWISWRIATARQKPAQESAGLRCLEVSDAGRSDVYCLVVPATHSFCVESGVVVHNCMDATRYFVKSGRDRMRTAPSKDKPKFQALDFSSLRGAWMQ